MFRKRDIPQTLSNAGFVKTLGGALFLALLLVFAQNAYARRAPTLPNAYDGAVPGARSLAMGSVGTGMPLSNESFYYNAAALGNTYGTRFELGIIMSRSSDAQPNEVAVFEPSGNGLVSAVAINKEGALVWNSLSDYSYVSYDNDGGWDKTETVINALTIAAGKKNDRGFNMGLNLTYLYGKIGETSYNGITKLSDSNIASGNGFTFDMSFMYPAGQSLYFGINFKNIAGFMFWDDYNTEQLPFSIRTGTAYVLRGFVLAVDYDKKFYRFGDLNEDTVHFGLEQYLNNFACVRGGIVSDNDFDTDSMRYSYGIGIKIKGYEIDFAGQQYKIDDEQFSKFMLSLSAMVQ